MSRSPSGIADGNARRLLRVKDGGPVEPREREPRGSVDDLPVSQWRRAGTTCRTTASTLAPWTLRAGSLLVLDGLLGGGLGDSELELGRRGGLAQGGRGDDGGVGAGRQL